MRLAAALLLLALSGCADGVIVRCQGDSETHYAKWWELSEEHIVLFYGSRGTGVYELDKCGVEYTYGNMRAP